LLSVCLRPRHLTELHVHTVQAHKSLTRRRRRRTSAATLTMKASMMLRRRRERVRGQVRELARARGPPAGGSEDEN
jgi:hypothetical protein